MSLTRRRLAEKAAAVERHLRRVADRLPAPDEPFEPSTDASDAVILHLWQATQLVIDVALSTALTAGGTAPPTYADAFLVLADHHLIDDELAARLVRAAGFRNVLVHAYETLDLRRVRDAATNGPEDLRTFLAVCRDALPG